MVFLVVGLMRHGSVRLEANHNDKATAQMVIGHPGILFPMSPQTTTSCACHHRPTKYGWLAAALSGLEGDTHDAPV
jgi:hypothetical protein